MKTYNLNSRDCYLNQSQLKEKDINMIVHIIRHSRHCGDISFSGYGHVTYTEEDEHKKEHPIVTEIDGYSRKNCEVAIFDIHVASGDDRFNKLFLYKSNGKSFPYYGYWAINEKTGYQSNINYIYGETVSDIIVKINCLLNSIQRHDPIVMKDFKEKNKKENNTNTKVSFVSTNRYRVYYDDLPQIKGTNKTLGIGDYNKAYALL